MVTLCLSQMWQYSVVILLTLLVSMTLTMCWSQYSRTTRSHDSHVMQTNGTRRNMEYYDNGSLRTHHMMGGGGHVTGGGGHVTGGDGHVISMEPPLWNGITKSSHIGNQTGLLGATESSLPTDQVCSQTSMWCWVCLPPLSSPPSPSSLPLLPPPPLSPSSLSLLSPPQPWSRVVKKRKKKTKTL